MKHLMLLIIPLILLSSCEVIDEPYYAPGYPPPPQVEVQPEYYTHRHQHYHQDQYRVRPNVRNYHGHPNTGSDVTIANSNNVHGHPQGQPNVHSYPQGQPNVHNHGGENVHNHNQQNVHQHEDAKEETVIHNHPSESSEEVQVNVHGHS